MNKNLLWFFIIITGTFFAQDTTPPVAICQDTTVSLDEFGTAFITALDIDNGSSDDVEIASLTVNPSNFDCSNIGLNTVTLTIEDTSGNTATCTATVTVEDNLPPIVSCNPITRSLVGGSYSLSTVDLQEMGMGTTDNCSTVTFTASPNVFDCDDVFNPQLINLVITGVADINNEPIIIPPQTQEGPRVQLVELYVIQDIADLSLYGIGVANDGGGSDGEEFTFPPVVATAGDFIYIAFDATSFNNFFSFSPNYSDASIDLDGNDAVELFFNGSVIDVFGETTVDGTDEPWEYTDGWSYRVNQTQPSSTFIVENWIFTGTEIWVNAQDNASAVAPFPLNGYELDLSGTLSPIMVTLTATDNEGNQNTCSVEVTIEDTTPPVAICQNFTLNLSEDGEAFLSEADLDTISTASSDNCGIAFVSGQTSFTCDDLGTNLIEYTITDSFGNTSTCTASVQVNDISPPIANCLSGLITLELDASGEATLTPENVNSLSSDSCGSISLSLDKTIFTCADLGNNTVVLTVDDGNGNSDTCTATVNVVNTNNPVAVCQEVTIQLNAVGVATLNANLIDNGSTVTCGIPSFSANITSFDCSNIGDNSVLFTVTDQNGNESTCTTNVIVEDMIPPVANANNITVSLNPSGTLSITGAQVNNGSTDNCGIASFAVSPDTFDCDDTINPVLVTLTVTDTEGNSATDTAFVTVVDDTPPLAICNAFTLPLDTTGTAILTVQDIDGGSEVSCGNATLSIDTTSFTCNDIGPNTVVLSITNNNGVTSTCATTVTVVDNLAPTVICQDATVFLDASGNASISLVDIDNGTSDACGIASLNLNTTSFDCSNVGLNTVTLTAIDNEGNSASCNATVTVIDTVFPTAVCQNITVSLNASGTITIDPMQIDGGSTDFCGITSRSIDITTFDCSNIGANNVILTVTDASGNSSSCNAVVTIEDTTPPEVFCQNITLQLDANGSVFIDAADIDNGSNDICGIASTTLSNSIFNCSNVGANTVILTVTDTSGNTSTCIASVTVQDVTPPTMICQNITVELDASGTAFISELDIDVGTSDACGIANVFIDINSFSCDDLGANNVLLSATDTFGNTASCTAIVTVVDILDPEIDCPPTQVVAPDSSGNYIVPNFEDLGFINSLDNCTNPITLFSQNPPEGTSLTLGTYTVSITAEDASGNSNSCNFQLVVDENLATNDNEIDNWFIFPNPTQKKISIVGTNNEVLKSFTIYDLLGRKVIQENFEFSLNSYDVDVFNLAAATYLLEINTDKQTLIKRFIKE